MTGVIDQLGGLRDLAASSFPIYVACRLSGSSQRMPCAPPLVVAVWRTTNVPRRPRSWSRPSRHALGLNSICLCWPLPVPSPPCSSMDCYHRLRSWRARNVGRAFSCSPWSQPGLLDSRSLNLGEPRFLLVNAWLWITSGFS